MDAGCTNVQVKDILADASQRQFVVTECSSHMSLTSVSLKEAREKRQRECKVEMESVYNQADMWHNSGILNKIHFFYMLFRMDTFLNVSPVLFH